jgi:hypothetical protein
VINDLDPDPRSPNQTMAFSLAYGKIHFGEIEMARRSGVKNNSVERGRKGEVEVEQHE